MLLYSLLYLTGLRRRARRPQAVPPVGLDHARPPRVRRSRPASRPRPGRWVRASRTRSGWRSPSAGWPFEFNRPGHDLVDHRTYVIVLRRRPPGRRRVGGVLARRAPPPGQADGALRRQPDPAGRADRDGRSPRTSLGRFAAYGWHTQRVEDGNDVEAIDRAIDAAEADDRAVDHRRSHPHRLRLAEQAGFAEGARRAARSRRGPPHQGGVRLGPGQDVLRARRSAGAVPRRRRQRQASAPSVGGPARRLSPTRSRPRRPSSSDGSPAGFRTAGTAACRRTRPASEVATRNASQDAIQALAGHAAGAVRRVGRPVGVEPDRRQGERAGPLRGRGTRAGTCASACASTGWAAIANGIAYHGGFLPYGATFLTFSDYMRGRSGSRPCPGSTWCTSGRTTRSGWARTDRRTSRSSTTRRCARSPTCGSCGPATPTRRRRRGRWRSSAGRSRTRPGRPGAHPAEAADAPGHGEHGARGRAARRLRPARGGAAGRRELILIGTGSELQLAVRRGRRARGRRDPDARRLAALLGALRAPGPGVPRLGAAAGRPKRVSVEAGVSMGWERCVGDEGAIIGLDHFGASAPAGTIFEAFGFTADRVADVGPAGRPGGPPRADPDARGAPHADGGDGSTPRCRPARGHRPHPGTTRARLAMRVVFAADHAGAPLQGRAPPSARRGSRRRARAHRPRRGRLRPRRRLPGLRPAPGDAIIAGRADRGILICGSGVGASIAACKMRGVRSAVCHDTYSAHQGVEHDDMNVLTLGARVIGPEPAGRMRPRPFLAAALQWGKGLATSGDWARSWPSSRPPPPGRRHVGRRGGIVRSRTRTILPTSHLDSIAPRRGEPKRRRGMRIGFIGLGRMGANMVRRGLRDQHEIVAYNRTPEKTTRDRGRRRRRQRSPSPSWSASSRSRARCG